MQIREVVVNEVRERLRWVHAGIMLLVTAPRGALIPSMVQ
jgi:hypothetical protein